MNKNNIVNNDSYLIIKHGALGDLFQGLDAFESLRKSFPSAKLTLLTSPTFASLAVLMPYFDSIIIDERKPFYNLTKTREIQKHFQKNWSAVIDLQCSKRTSAYFKWFYKSTGGKWFGTARGCSHPMADFTKLNNRDRMLEAVKMAGAKAYKANLSWLVDNRTKSMLPFQLETPYCLIIPGSSPNKPSKRWSPAGYAELSSRIYELGITPYLVGTKSENSVIEEICTLSHVAESLIDKTDLEQLAQLCCNAQFVIGNDTGPTFLAAKTGIATLMLMGHDTNPQMSSPTGNLVGYIHKSDIQSITVNEIINKMQELKGGLLP